MKAVKAGAKWVGEWEAGVEGEERGRKGRRRDEGNREGEEGEEGLGGEGTTRKEGEGKAEGRGGERSAALTSPSRQLQSRAAAGACSECSSPIPRAGS